MTALTPIPSPLALPLLGNALNVDASYILGSLEQLADTYGKAALLPHAVSIH